MRFRDTNDNPDLDPAPLPDVRDAEWYRVVAEIRELRADKAYHWAEAHLAGIQDRIERSRRVTEGQYQALERIRSQEWAPGRSYDAFGTGHGRRWR